MKNEVCLLALAFLSAPSSAQACSPACGTSFSPVGTLEAPAHLPANGVFVDAWGPSGEITLVRTRAGETETRSLGTALRGAEIQDVAAGDRLVLSMDGCGSVVTTVIEVTSAAPVPTQLGVLAVQASRRADVAVWDNRGSCTSDLASTVAPYTLTLDPSLEPWADALIQSPMVDGAPWYDRDDETVAPRFVFAACETPLPSQNGLQDIGVGSHRLRVDATLRGMDVRLASNEETFTLECGSWASGCAAAAPRRWDRGLLAFSLTALTMVLMRVRSKRAR